MLDGFGVAFQIETIGVAFRRQHHRTVQDEC
jgi:hypothetical protein